MRKEVIQCDRCGEVFDSLNRDSGNRQVEFRYAPARELENNYDLCKACVKIVKETIEGKR